MKLHPLSIPYRVVQYGLPTVFSLLFVASAVAPVYLIPGIALFVLAIVAYQVAYFRRFEYELAPDTFDIRSGVVSRRNREIPLRRIQNVDIRQNVFQRILGIAAVALETAGGGETEVSLRFVDFAEAKRLQREISRLKHEEAAEEQRPEPDAETLFEITGRELALIGALSFDFRFSGLVALLFTGSIPFFDLGLDTDTALLGVGILGLLLVLTLASWAVSAVLKMANYYGFRLSRTADDLQYERGLLQRYDGSIPLDKVQTLTIADNPLKRRLGYATLSIETAGYSPGEGPSGGSEAAVPLADRERVVSLARSIEPFGDPAFARPPKRVRRRYVGRYLIAIGAVTAVLFGIQYAVNAFVRPVSFPWFAPLALLVLVPVAAHVKWKHRGYWLGDDHVVTRNGFWSRRTKIVPYYRIQTVIDSRSPFQRRWHLATVTIDTAGSLSILNQDAAAVDVDESDANGVRDALAERLRAAVAARQAA